MASADASAMPTSPPVVGSDVVGIAEFATHEFNGLLFKRASIDGLAHRMGRIIGEPALLDRLRAGIPAVKTIESEVDGATVDLSRTLGARVL